MSAFVQIWKRIVEYEGSEFRQVRGKTFTYTVSGNALVPSTTNYLIPRSQIEKAWKRMPVAGPGGLQDLVAPSYLYAILSDPRISIRTEEIL